MCKNAQFFKQSINVIENEYTWQITLGLGIRQGTPQYSSSSQDPAWLFTYLVFRKWSSYSVMHSDGNSSCGDVVSDRFNKTNRDEDNILEQIYKSKYVCIIILTILILYNIIRKCIHTLH